MSFICFVIISIVYMDTHHGMNVDVKSVGIPMVLLKEYGDGGLYRTVLYRVVKDRSAYIK